MGDTEQELGACARAKCLARLDEERDLMGREPEGADTLRRRSHPIATAAVTRDDAQPAREKDRRIGSEGSSG